MGDKKRSLIDRHIGRQIRWARTAARMTQDQLAQKTCLTAKEIDFIELGITRVTAFQLKLFADTLEVSVEQLYDDFGIQASGSGRVASDRDMSQRLQAEILAKINTIQNEQQLKALSTMVEAFIAQLD